MIRDIRLSVFIFIFVFCSTFSFGKPSRFSHTVELRSRYIWRGLDFYDDDVPALQYTMNYAMGDSGTTLGLFTSMALNDRSIHKEWEEIDLFLEHAFPKKNGVKTTAGLLYYVFPHMRPTGFSKNTSFEYYLIFAFEKLPLEPTLTIAHDSQMGDGTYGNLSFSRSFGKKDKEFTFETSIGYNRHHWTTGTGWSEWDLSLERPISKDTNVTLGYTKVFLDSLNSSKDETWIGVSYEF